MGKPVLVIMAAGLGSRYGGLKQIAPVDDKGQILMDYAAYDAKRAGFETVVCIIAPGFEQEFRDAVGDRISRGMELKIAFQYPDTLPGGFTVPEGRVKPWGTAHAVLSAKELADGPIAVINADDYYGADAYRAVYNFLVDNPDKNHHAMVGYRLENTLTEYGQVARGVCKTEGGKLLEIVEHTRIQKREGGAESILDDDSRVFLPNDTTVSMNLWGFGSGIIEEIEVLFAGFLRENLLKNPLKCEYLLPQISNTLLREGTAEISVLATGEKWLGVTYAQDMPAVQAGLAEMRGEGKYPHDLWGDNA